MAATIRSHLLGRSFVCIAFALLVLALAFVNGCSQDEGEPCQVDRDCADGLECRGASNNERGQCVSKDEAQDTGDAGTPPEVDAALDAAKKPPPAADDDAGADDSDGG